MIITIDGPASSGKSTVAKVLAKKLGFYHFNSGSLYRAITAFLLTIKYNIDSMNEKSPLPKINLEVKFIDDVQHVFVNQIDFTSQIRDNHVSNLTPIVSSVPKIRKIVDTTQRKIAKKHNFVVDGRDIGSYVFPNAEYKFYLDCDVKIRAKRRYDELNDKTLTLKDIEKQIIARDEYDKNKKIAPLVIPKNAIIIDSSNLTIDEVVKTMINHINIKF